MTKIESIGHEISMLRSCVKLDINRLDNNHIGNLRKLLDDYKKSIGEEQMTDEAFNRKLLI